MAFIKKPFFQWPAATALYASIVVFLTYGTIYAFRKPFTIATFDGLSFLGIHYKVCLIISQLIGYVASKFYGIKFIAELNKAGRWKTLLILIGISWLSLFFFAITPAPFNIIFLFLNGFPLGITWGIVFSYIEGRRATDFIGAALSVSFIFSSGFVKSVAKYLQLQWHVTEFWLPFLTGLIFILPLLFFTFLLEKIPAPTPDDVLLRNERNPLDKGERKKLVTKYFPGILMLITLYTLLTIFRDMRDNFAADIWKELGFGNESAIFTQTEIPVTLIVLALTGSLVFIKNNFMAFIVAHIFIATGFFLSGISTWFFLHQMIGPANWMILVGVGLYMAYIPFNCMLYDRLIAAFRINGNTGFLMYCSDSFGYLGSAIILLGKEILHIQLHWVSFFSNGILIAAVAGIIGTAISGVYFLNKHQKKSPTCSSTGPSLSEPVLQALQPQGL